MSLNLGDVLVKFLGNNEDFLKATKENINATEKLEKETEKSLKNIAKQSKATGKALTLGLSVPIIGALGLSGAAFLTFDDKMSESLSIMGNVNEGMRKELADTAKQISGESIFAASELAEAYFFLASAGKTAEQSIALLPVVTKFATAGAFELALATDLLTDAQSALGLTSKDAAQDLINMTRVSDVLVKANTLANASVQQFAESLTNRAAAALRILNKDVEEGVAVLAVFADQGIKGARAGEGLAIVLRDLQTKAVENAAAFRDSSIAVFDQEGKMNKISDIIKDLTTRIGSMSDEQRRAELSMLGFTDRSISNLTALIGTSEQIERYEKALRSAGGVTDEVANKQLESFAKQLKILRNIITNTAASFGEAFVPALVDALNETKPFLRSLEQMDSSSKNLIITLALIAAAVGPALIAFGFMAQGIVALTALFATLGGAVAGIGIIFAAVGVSFFAIGQKMSEAFLGIPQIEADTMKLVSAQESLAVAMAKVVRQAKSLAKDQEQIRLDKAAINEKTSLENILKLNIRINEFNLKRVKLEREAQRERGKALNQQGGSGTSSFFENTQKKFNAELKITEDQLKKNKAALAALTEEEKKRQTVVGLEKTVAQLTQKALTIQDPLAGQVEATQMRFQAVLKVIEKIRLANKNNETVQNAINNAIAKAVILREAELNAIKIVQEGILADFILNEEQKSLITILEGKKRAEEAAKFALNEQLARTLAEAQGEADRARIRKQFNQKEIAVQSAIDAAFQNRLSSLIAVLPDLKGVVKGSFEAVKAERDDGDTQEEKDIDKIQKNTKNTSRILGDIKRTGISVNIGVAEIR